MSTRPDQPRVNVTLSRFAYEELKRLSTGTEKPMGALAASALEQWIFSPSFASLLKRLPSERSEESEAPKE